jgi:hypothetical protein
MDVLNGLHIEPDDLTNLSRISKGIDLRKPATEHDYESKPNSKGIDLRMPATEHDLTSLSRNKPAN